MLTTVAVQDLRIGMFVHLDLGWMSHPFALSSFRIASADQIETIRGLGVTHVKWAPDKSEPADSENVVQLPVAPPVDEQALRLMAAKERRREQLAAQRAAARVCDGQYLEATSALEQINVRLLTQPVPAGRLAEALTRAMLDKMLGDGDLCVRLLGTAATDRAAAHGLNVTVIAMLMGRTLGLQDAELMDIGVGALLHDVGKIDLPERVHHLDGCAAGAETNAYRDHVTLGLQRGRKMGLGAGALQVLAQHHEHADGSGFPKRVTGEAMTIAARIVAVVNRYDNLCNPGPRGHPLTPHEAVALLFAQNRSKFDATILNAFIRMMGVYPAGSVVQLTDDRFALVMAVNSSRPLKPTVLVHDPKVPRDEALFVNLEHHGDLGIRRSLPSQKLPQAAFNYLMPRPRVAYYFEALTAPVLAPAEELA